MELKTHNYNFDDAAATGFGPAFVMQPGKIISCDLPGCYYDTDFLSATNAYGEYQEPSVAVGIAPGQAKHVQSGRTYTARLSGTPGRGDRALMKISYYLTQEVAPMGESGYFHCSDTSVKRVLRYEDRYYAPGCVKNTDLSTQRC